ncbi:CRISPR-associated endonuclease Cas1 [Eggerthellaceae bacterium zg-887]|uniref:CRISPR-associated endonuclease Cas1 n=1 Tax=Xiamenia xianingshaonis TaxID=2682776 RepID=UPI00140D6605|nr:CRISPR-associated endonuclease Cas1 [Xiamenia xianingshaonis]NHM16475.1 CRISPR-associated endonuclease Cas1 [Xiamenia xianingshaonis]
MSYLYLTESGISLGFSQGSVTVKQKEREEAQTLPLANIDGISVFGKAQLSTQLIRECMAANISIGYYSDEGHYFGKISSFNRIDPDRQKRQVYLTDDAWFCLALSRKIIDAKIRNSLALLNSMRNIYDFEEGDLRGLTHSLNNLRSANSVEMVLGFEGSAARCYFKCLSKLLLDDAFAFRGRNAHPPKDPFNSMISYGYSLLYRNIIGAVERHGLHPYFAYLHKQKYGHAALASDLIEEFRSPLVDKTILDFINAGEVDISEFSCNESGATYLNRSAMKRLTDRFSEILARNQQYFLSYGDRKSYGFQVMLDKKIDSLIDAIEHRDPQRYQPFIWESGRQWATA